MIKSIPKYSFFFLWMSCTLAFGQLDSYGYQQELQGISEQWHKITLPNETFDQVNSDFSDIRIYGLTKGDTLEAPYILKIASGRDNQKEVDFTLLNTASNANGHYFTFEVPTTEAINEIQLDFKDRNFDWHIALEGSQEQQNWFTVLERYRILSIKNEQTDYTFTDLNFPKSKYRYYRLLIKTEKRPELLSAKIRLDERAEATYREYPIPFMDIVQKNKNTVIDIDLKQRLPLSYLKFNVSDSIDYYRPITVQFVSDSVKTEKGWKYSYGNLTTGTLASLENNVFTFENTLARKLRITVQNHDNRPLHIESAEAKGYIHELIACFAEPADYYLTYGNPQARKPYYDIVQAATSIPDNLSALTLGEIRQIPKKESPKISALFENKLWLWGVMGVVILVLGWFTLGMMRRR